jgi:hypothetical protein
MISALGRADFLHLLFSCSELPILLYVGLVLIRPSSFEVSRIMLALASTIGFAGLFLLGMHGKSSVLLGIPIFVSIFGFIEHRRASGARAQAVGTAKIADCLHPPAALTGVILTLAIFYPSSVSALKFGLDSPDRPLIDPVMGVQLPNGMSREVRLVQNFISEHQAISIFCYPNRSVFYALVAHHGARLASFEPQTTTTELTDTINDLQRNSPPVIIRDLDQIAGMSRGLAPLSDWVNSNYRVIDIVTGPYQLELLEKRAHPVPMQRLFDHIYTLNSDTASLTPGIRTMDDGHRQPVVAVNRGIARFSLPDNGGRVFRARIFPEPDWSQSGTLVLSKAGTTINRTVSALDGWVEVPLPPGEAPVEVELQSSQRDKPVLWVDPTITLSGE